MTRLFQLGGCPNLQVNWTWWLSHWFVSLHDHLHASCMMDLLAWFKILLASHLRPTDLQGSSRCSFFLRLAAHYRGNSLPMLAHDLSCSCLKSRFQEWNSHTKTQKHINQSGNIQTKEAILKAMLWNSQGYKGQYPTCERWNLLRRGFPPLTGPSSIPSSHGTLVRLIDKATHCVLGPWRFRIPLDDKIVKHFWQSWESVRHDTSPKRK